MAGKRAIWIIALLVAAGAIGWIALGGLGDNLVYYWSPSEMAQAGDKAHGALIRLGGQVKPGTVESKPGATDLRFVVTDGTTEVQVHTQSLPPQMFREGIGVVVEGTLARSGVFESDRMLVKHNNEYKAPEKGHKGEDVKKLMKSVLTEGDNQ